MKKFVLNRTAEALTFTIIGWLLNFFTYCYLFSFHESKTKVKIRKLC